ncbi:hypothetical protein [Sinomicrobium weinanense]|uniref:Uncharacterized protein n=1 Tax=Sinomicrobium weinanense TaxID=2842200 RepID=A0A926JVA3_9FLAO|nr:hypothetical protein [Sinomicrobium weinanense]MBC9797811.1 hypothetical protein [Sinomicrobium weinanense]MBU3125960.1 hypothetical protein [Sinomicrobium weinanense]
MRKLVFILFLVLFACEQENNTSDELNQKWRGKKVSFTDDLEPFVTQANRKSDSGVKNRTVVAYYDGNCSSCYKELLKWIHVKEDFIEKGYHVDFKFILSGYNKALVKGYLKQVKFPLEDVFYASKNSFIEKYSFLTEINYEYSSMLLDRNNKILLIGNPTTSERILKIFTELVRQD